MASERLDGLAGRRVLVLGAGAMAEGMVRNLAAADAAEILIANRTAARAHEVAAAVGGRAIELGDVLPALPDVDLLLTSTGATSIILDHGDIASAIGERTRPLVIVDVAVPRDIDPAVRDLPHVVLLDMDDLRQFADTGRERRVAEVAAVEQLIDDQLQRWVQSRSAHQAAPLIGALHQEAERVRRAELERFRTTLDDLTPEQRATVEHLTSAIVQKLLHPPSVALKRSAGTPKGERLTTTLRDLFDL
jgi:glutamyl-tRNA reductase